MPHVNSPALGLKSGPWPAWRIASESVHLVAGFFLVTITPSDRDVFLAELRGKLAHTGIG
jgi:hypothetical protein